MDRYLSEKSLLLKQYFQVARPNEKWVGDTTCIETGEGWLYFATVIDLFSRKLIR